MSASPRPKSEKESPQKAASKIKPPSSSVRDDFTRLFDLPRDTLLADFSCALQMKIRYHGRMYIARQFVCFTSNIFGETRLVRHTRSRARACLGFAPRLTAARAPDFLQVLPVADIRSIERKTSMLVMPDAIEIVCGDAPDTEKFLFTSFLMRQEAYAVLLDAWQASADGQQNTSTSSVSGEEALSSSNDNAVSAEASERDAKRPQRRDDSGSAWRNAMQSPSSEAERAAEEPQAADADANERASAVHADDGSAAAASAERAADADGSNSNRASSSAAAERDPAADRAAGDRQSSTRSRRPLSAAEKIAAATSERSEHSMSPPELRRGRSTTNVTLSQRNQPMLSAMPSLMPKGEGSGDDVVLTLPFVSRSCTHVVASVDEIFRSASANSKTTLHQELPHCTLAEVWHTLFRSTDFWRRVHRAVGYMDFEGSPWRSRFPNGSEAASAANSDPSALRDSNGSEFVSVLHLRFLSDI